MAGIEMIARRDFITIVAGTASRVRPECNWNSLDKVQSEAGEVEDRVPSDSRNDAFGRIDLTRSIVSRPTVDHEIADC
jgi:hypothetical protein